MDSLSLIRQRIASRRKALGMRQQTLAQKARVSLPTLKSLEQGKLGELGFSKLTRILSVLGMELRLQEANRGRPTLEDLESESANEVSGAAGEASPMILPR